ncbi:MAG TPA: ceramidase domain-containing protein [Dermatophilaceae bacterium]|nr:ceramidase domain-containing protein [Actinomycetales bacterium]HMT91206.1 ceramidase domain-containing protein [Dermatophilaceae bacterium]
MTSRPADVSRTAYVMGVLALALTALAAVEFARPGALDIRPATCLDPTTNQGAQPRCFCEAVGSGLLRQPANALSNLAFLVAGAAAYRSVRAINRTRPERALAGAAALATIAVGAGSLAYHGGLTFAGQLLDVQGMYLIAVLLLVGSCRGSPFAHRTLPLALTSLATLAAIQWALPGTRRWLFAVVLLPGIVLEARRAPGSPSLRAAVGLLTLGYAVWLADERGLWCDPGSLLQGHAVWHLATAGAAYLLVRHYRWASGRAPESGTSGPQIQAPRETGNPGTRPGTLGRSEIE